MDLYNHCVAFSVLPKPGGLLNQDNKTLEAFSVIRAEYAKADKEHADKQRSQLRQGR